MSTRAAGRPARRAEAAAPPPAQVTDLAHDGRGIAHVQGKTVFIEDALPGEEVEWRRVKRGRNFDEGRLVRILSASDDRVEPRCAHFGTCGGCALQHLAVSRQLEFKQDQLLQALARIGQVSPAQLLPALQEEVWGYRRRARLAARWVAKKGRTVLGFRERHAPYVADLRGCEVLPAPVAALIEPLSEVLSALSIRDRVPQVEVAVADNAVALVVRVLQSPSAEDLERLRQFARQRLVRIYLQPGGYDTVAPLPAQGAGDVSAHPPEQAGDDWDSPLYYRLPQFELTLQFLPTDFIQVNAAMNARMVERAIELLEPAAGERILDLYCGLGNFSLALARSGAEIVGVEGEAGLVERARANARLNGLANASFFVANLAEQSVQEAPWAAQGYDKVLLDPPRAGALQMLPRIAASGARMVLYVSCHPGSLARDAGLLVHEHGYTLQAAGVMDMFPHTAHVESAALFVRARA